MLVCARSGRNLRCASDHAVRRFRLMESKAKVAGHAAHPMLVVFPLGLLATSMIFDLIALAAGYPDLHIAAYWMILAGVIGGLVAAIPGVIDLVSIPRGTRAFYIGLWHGVGNVGVLTLFAISFILRYGIASDPGAIPVLLSVIAAGAAMVTGWLGGELVERLGVGVDDGAHLDAPSSFSRRGAGERSSATYIRRPVDVEP